ncbi:MAG: pirin family protein, partial [Cyanobacteriota bacterium]|nr:pirin family protein [Cyanobacteriota bacterium]
IQRPVHLWRANLAKGKTLDLPSIEASHRWLQVIDGEIELSGLSGSNTLRRGDGLGFRGRPTDLETLKSHCDHSDLLLFALN